MKAMRIVNAMFGRGIGGIEQALVDYCEALYSCGHEPFAIIRPRAAVREALIARGIPFHELPNLGSWDPVAAMKLKKLLARVRPDASIAHGNRAVSLLLAAGAPRVIGALHNYKIKTDKLSHLFYPTQDLLRHAQSKGGVGKHFYPVPNLVRVPGSEPERDWHEPPVIGAMGRFVAKKGYDVLIEALTLMKERNIPFRAALAGDGEEMAALKSLASRRGLSDVLHFAGWVENKQAFFDSVDIFCLPSTHEPFGIVLLEAMAQALPVVATDSEGPSEIVHDGLDGVLVQKANPIALASALITLLADRRRAELLARNAFDTVKNRYDLPVVAHKLDLALRSVTRL